MKHKLLFGVFAAAGVLLATSCSNDEFESSQAGDEATVTFSLGVDAAVQTRAISDGLTVDQFIYAIYDANGDSLSISGAGKNNQVTKDAFTNTLNESVSVTLAKGQTYTAVFWAQKKDSAYYDTGNLKQLKVDYSGNNNSESRDAFYAAEKFTVTGSTTINVTLKRPFAQINVGVTTADWNAALESNDTISLSSVTFSDVADQINLLTGEVSVSGSETKSITYYPATIPTESLTVDVDGSGSIGDGETFKWLSMSYILVNDQNSTDGSSSATTTASFTFKGTNGTQDISVSDGLENITVQRNYRTNIIGQLLTGNILFQIVISPEYSGNHNNSITVSNVTQLTAAINDSTITTVVLASDVTDNSSAVSITSDKEIDLNGNALNVKNISVSSGKSLEVSNGTLNTYILGEGNGASITLDGVKITNTGYSVAIVSGGSGTKEGGSELTIKNSTIDVSEQSNATGIIVYGDNNTVTIENTTIEHSYMGITQNGVVPGSNITLTNVDITGPYSGVYLSNNASGQVNNLVVTGGKIHSENESAIEVKKTNIYVVGATLSSAATSQSYSVYSGGSNGVGYGIVLAGYTTGTAYDDSCTINLSNITYKLATTDSPIKAGKYNGSTLVEADSEGTLEQYDE